MSGYADEFIALVRDDPRRARQGRHGLPADVRHDRLDRQLPDRGRHRARRRRRGRHHGLRLPRRLVGPGRLGRADRRAGVRHRRHDRRLHRPRAGVQGDPRRAVLRPRLVDRQLARCTPANISGTKYGSSVTVRVRRRARLRPPARPQVRPRRRRGLDGVPAPELHRDLRLRQPAGASSTTTTPQALGAKYDLVNRYDLRGAGIWALGYDGTRPELYQALKDKFITDTDPAQDQQRVAQHADHLAQRRRPAARRRRCGSRHRSRQVRLDRPASDGERDRPRRSHRDEDRPAGASTPGTARTTRAPASRTVATGSRSGPRTPRTTARRSPRRRRSIGGPPSSACRPPRRPISPNGDRRSDTTLGLTGRSLVTGSAGSSTRAARRLRRWTFADAGSGAWTWDGRDGAVGRSPTAATRSASWASTGRQLEPSRPDASWSTGRSGR